MDENVSEYCQWALSQHWIQSAWVTFILWTHFLAFTTGNTRYAGTQLQRLKLTDAQKHWNPIYVGLIYVGLKPHICWIGMVFAFGIRIRCPDGLKRFWNAKNTVISSITSGQSISRHLVAGQIDGERVNKLRHESPKQSFRSMSVLCLLLYIIYAIPFVRV